jgi:hypothetical protein
VNDASAITGSDTEFFAHFKDAGSNFAARLDVVSASRSSDFSIGLATDSSVADSTLNESACIDNLVIGTSFNDVVSPCPATVPAPSTLLLMLVGLTYIRNAQRTAS